MSDWLREVEYAGYSIQYAGPESERSPLLSDHVRGSRCGRIFWVLFLTALFCTGLAIGCYLILQEDVEYPSRAPYVLISRDGWRALSAVKPIANYPNQLTHVVITQTSTANCDNISDCSKCLRDLQLDHVTARNLSDIAYNFIITGDGATYEGRGWRLQPDIKDVMVNRTLVVAFLGNFDYQLPPTSQIEECKVLIQRAVTKGTLDPCYTLILYKERPQDGGGQLGHVFSRLVAENNKRKLFVNCTSPS